MQLNILNTAICTYSYVYTYASVCEDNKKQIDILISKNPVHAANIIPRIIIIL